MRLAPLALLLLAPVAAADPPKWSAGKLAEARQRLQKGSYEEAKVQFAKAAAADPKLKPAAAVGVSRAQRAVGEDSAALDTLTAALGDAPKNPDLLAERGDLLFHVGQWDAAMKDADAALAAKEETLLAWWVKARVLRDRGQPAEADAAVRWVVRHYTARSNADRDIVDPDELLVVAECGAENARWNNLPKQFQFILNTVLADALASDPDQWRAETLAGHMLLEKFNKPEALAAFDKALAINPKAADALAGKALAALQRYDIKEAEQFAGQALKVNPRHPAALRVRADSLIIAGDLGVATEALSKAREVSPRDPATLGRLAACYLLQKKQAEFDAVVKDAESFDKAPGAFYHDLAEVLDGRKRFADAEGFYKKAAAVRPQLPGPRTGLGMMYLRLGDEPGGRKLLERAFDSDPFNVRVANSLKVMKHLDKYATTETPHYVLKYNPDTDAVLGEFVAEYLEETHAELKRQYGYEPTGKVLIEVFSTHEMFSGRITGLPDLHTVGASTGRLVAMAAPGAKGLKKPFHWGRVVKHELTHVFNLTQSDFLCPHWLTEGLAVRTEQLPRPRDWLTILRDRRAEGTLFNLDTVMFGFVRPKDASEWTLAYCQSNIYVEHLIRTHGEESVGKLLAAYKQGLDTTAALKAVGVDKAAFEQGYREYVDEILKPVPPKRGGDEKAMTVEELEEAHEKNPDDPDIAAQLAERTLKKVVRARQLVDEVLERKPGHPRAAVVKARLLMESGDVVSAKSTLAAALKLNPDDPRLLITAARLAMGEKEFDEATKYLEHGRKVAPYDGEWLQPLAKLYKESGDTQRLIDVLKELVANDGDELDGRLRLAQAYLDADKPELAEKHARDALMIDVKSVDGRKSLLQSLKAQGRTADAERLERRFAAK